MLIDPVYMINTFIEELYYAYELYQDNYDKFEVLIKVHDTFTCHTIGAITIRA